MTSAGGYYDTPFGRITARWERVDDGFAYTVALPEGIKYEFDLGEMRVLHEARDDRTVRVLVQ